MPYGAHKAPDSCIYPTYVTVCVGNYLSGSPPTPFDAQTALITNMFDPHDTCNVCITGQGVREDHSDPVRAIHLTKWLVKASYTDENEEISLVKKKPDL